MKQLEKTKKRIASAMAWLRYSLAHLHFYSFYIMWENRKKAGMSARKGPTP